MGGSNKKKGKNGKKKNRGLQISAEDAVQLEPSDASMAKQVMCPTQAKSKYKNYSSISFVTEKLIPEALGYMAGTAITGLGSRKDKNLLSRMGFAGEYGERVLGFNYFEPAGSTCPTQGSDSECAGKPRYTYIRNIPTDNNGLGKGLVVGGAAEDVLDMASADILTTFFSTAPTRFSGGCTARKLPVGSGLDQPDREFKSREKYEAAAHKCVKNDCGKMAKKGKPGFEVDNCIKDCMRGYWIEKQCTSDPQSYEYGGKRYRAKKKAKKEAFISSQSTNQSRPWWSLVGVISAAICVLLLISICCGLLFLFITGQNKKGNIKKYAMIF